MRARAIVLILFCLSLLPHRTALAQDSSSVYSTNRAAPSGGALNWLLGGGGRPSAKIIRVRPESRPRVYEPRRRSASVLRPSYRPALAPNRPYSGEPRPAASPPNGLPESAAVASPTPPLVAPPAMTIAVIGDSLSIFLAQGLAEAYADRPNLTFIKRNREASGLVRDDYYDWPKNMREMIATSAKLDAILIQIGSNDRQQLRDSEGVIEPRTDKWRTAYVRRIDEMIAIARDKKIPMIWVGLPTMRGERYNTDILALNDLYKSRAAAAGVAFVDIWEAFAGEDSTYTVNGPDVDGTIVRLRSADGVHFTRAGSRKLAFFADKELKRIVAVIQDKVPQPAIARLPTVEAPKASPAAAVPAPAPNGLNVPALPELTLPPALQSTDALLNVPLPETPMQTSLRARPIQGPVILLNAAPVTTGGKLLTSPLATPEPEIFRSGTSTATKAGRTDDFRLTPQ